MKLRADLTINGEERRPLLVSGPSEPDDHLAHRLAAYMLFWGFEPVLDATTKHPALADFEFLPDLFAVDAAGDPVLWVECGSVTMNKLTKVTRRMPRARVVVMKETERSGAELRKLLVDGFDRPERVEVLAWPGDSYKKWAATVGDQVEAFGETGGLTINAVVNGEMVVVDFKNY